MDSINRTFIGVRVPPDLQLVVDRSLLLLKRKPGILDMRWSQPQEWILNMVTLGELNVGSIARIAEALQMALKDQPSFEMTMERFVGLPNMIQPRFAVLQLTGEGTQTCIDLANRLDQVTKTMTPMRDSKPFQPNVVMGRLKTESEQLRVSLGRALKMPEQEAIATWKIDQIELLVSTASTQGVGYKAVEVFPLS